MSVWPLLTTQQDTTGQHLQRSGGPELVFNKIGDLLWNGNSMLWKDLHWIHCIHLVFSRCSTNRKLYMWAGRCVVWLFRRCGARRPGEEELHPHDAHFVQRRYFVAVWPLRTADWELEGRKSHQDFHAQKLCSHFTPTWLKHLYGCFFAFVWKHQYNLPKFHLKQECIRFGPFFCVVLGVQPLRGVWSWRDTALVLWEGTKGLFTHNEI